MCTTLLAGKNATVSGCVLFGANDDWDNVPGVLTHEPRKVHMPGTTETYTVSIRKAGSE